MVQIRFIIGTSPARLQNHGCEISGCGNGETRSGRVGLALVPQTSDREYNGQSISASPGLARTVRMAARPSSYLQRTSAAPFGFTLG